MKRLWLGFGVALTLLGSLTPSPALAEERGRGFQTHEIERWRHGEIARFHERDFERWRAGHWFHGERLGRPGWWWVVDGTWYFYPGPIYPYPDPYIPPNVVAEAPASSCYYCPSQHEYYPVRHELSGRVATRAGHDGAGRPVSHATLQTCGAALVDIVAGGHR
jgi:hypothetical protein